MIDPEAVIERGRSPGRQLKDYREARHLTQEQLARRVNYKRSTVANAEIDHSTPSRTFWERCDQVLAADGALFRAYRRSQLARRRGSASGSATITAMDALDGDPHAWFKQVVAALDDRGVTAARSVVADWQQHDAIDPAWITWVDELIALTSRGRLQPASRRPLPSKETGAFPGRDQQVTALQDFLGRTQQGRGGLALVLGSVGMGKSRLLVEVLADWHHDVQVEWITFDRGEAGYRGWRRLLAPLWTRLRRSELAPAGILAHAKALDDILLTGSEKPLPWEVAAAIAALLDHLAARKPVALVIDDAHRGGVSSDSLLVDVAERVSASGAAIIAALRPDELKEDSPVRPYCDQPDDRVAQDVVVPIHVAPLDAKATAGLIRERAGIEPPSSIVDQVLRQTGGCPQLIKLTGLHAPGGRAARATWVIDRLNTAGLRVLDSTLQSRPEAVRTVLYAAALCSTGGCIEPDQVALVTDLPAETIEQVLDDERQRGPILLPNVPGFCFQHDSWIEAIRTACPAPQLRRLHARCLAVLQSDAASDPQRLAWHALRAGASLVGAKTLLAVAKEAAAAALADYAFADAVELYGAAAQYAPGKERIELLIGQADALRFRGDWGRARSVLKSAASLARRLNIAALQAVALIHLERLTWSYGLIEKELTEQIREVIGRLPSDDLVLRMQTQAALAQRLSITPREYENEQINLAKAIQQEIQSVPDTDPLARADIILGIRNGLQDSSSPDELLKYDSQLLSLALRLHSAFHIAEAMSARFTDLVRAGRFLALPPAVRELRDFARQSGTPVYTYTVALIDAMMALARGDFHAAEESTAELATLSAAWGESVAGETLMALTGWRLYETGRLEGLTEILTQLPQQDVSSLNEPVWSLAAGLIHAEQGNLEAAIHQFREVSVSTREFRGLPRGPSRIAILATATMVLGHPLLRTELSLDERVRWGSNLADLLADHSDSIVVAGWPAVILGSKHRYIGLAYLATDQPAKAVKHLSYAAEQNSEFPALLARTRFDLARALIRDPDTRSEGTAEMGCVEQIAAQHGMASLAAQARDELAKQGTFSPLLGPTARR